LREPGRTPLFLLAILGLSGLVACSDAKPPLTQDASAARLLTQADPDRGRRLIAEKGCIACHTVPQVRAPVSTVGPPLNDMRRRAYLSGLLPNTPVNLVQWLLDPPAVNPRTAMPNTGLSVAQAEDIAAFLISLP